MEAGPQIRTFFDEASPYLADSRLTAERTKAEIDEVERLVGSVSGRILDVGCGAGRHSIELARRFADVTGIDQSSAMIDEARSRAAAANQFADFVCVDACDFREVARYDVALSLFGALGHQMTSGRDDSQHLAVLRRVQKALRPGGKLVVEAPDRDRVVAQLVETEQDETTKITRSFDNRESTATERFRVQSGDLYRLIYRLFDTTELADLLHDAGFDVLEALDRGLTEASPTMTTFLAQRPA